MKKNKGFTLIEVVIIVAIIGVLSMIAVPAYKYYMLRVENAYVLNDLNIIARELRIKLIEVDFGSSAYTSDSLRKIAPPDTIDNAYFGCFAPGYRLHRLQWTNPKKISRILNNNRSKIKLLDIETYQPDSSCTAANSKSDLTNFHQTLYFSLDYEAYGVTPPKVSAGYPTGGAIFIIIGGHNTYYDKNMKVSKVITDITSINCGLGHIEGFASLLPKSVYPAECRYKITSVMQPNRMFNRTYTPL